MGFSQGRAGGGLKEIPRGLNGIKKTRGDRFANHLALTRAAHGKPDEESLAFQFRQAAV